MCALEHISDFCLPLLLPPSCSYCPFLFLAPLSSDTQELLTLVPSAKQVKHSPTAPVKKESSSGSDSSTESDDDVSVNALVCTIRFSASLFFLTCHHY